MVESLSAAGCHIEYDYQYDGLQRRDSPEIPGPKWVHNLVGAEYFIDIVQLSFQGNENTVNADLQPIRQLNNLRRLDLDYTDVDDIAPIKHLRSLKWLDLEETKIDDEDLENLAKMDQLEILVLSRNKITDSGIRFLKGLTGLTRLRLNETEITDACVDDLRHLSNLVSLEMCRTNVTAEGAARLKEQLPDCRIRWGEDSY